MNVIIPMAGMGKRMRPHTLTIPKPLVPIAGKPIVQRLVEDIAKVCHQPVQHIAFIIKSDFGTAIEQKLLEIAQMQGAQGHICYQDEPLGTAHAILCAQQFLDGPTVVAFADTLFKADFIMPADAESAIWVQSVEDPSAFGVIKLNENGEIDAFVEKPKEFVSDLAIIGIYYVRNGAALREALQYLIDNDIKEKGEYQLTNALDNLRKNGMRFVPCQINEWLDCGNKDATVFTNQRYLEYIKDQPLIAPSAIIEHSVIIPPVFIGEGVKIAHSVIGPHVSVGNNTQINRSVVQNTIIQESSVLSALNLANAMIGSFVEYSGTPVDISLGDYNVIKT